MGRNYLGDIEFGVDDADFFGGCKGELHSIYYAFTEDDLPDIEKGIEECKAKSLYARLELGEKILACVKERGGCCFEVKL